MNRKGEIFMDIFTFINMQAHEPCLQNDELYIAEGKWLQLDSIQYSPLNVKALKKQYGTTFSITIPCIGKLLVKVGVKDKEKSFIWCGEKTIIARKPKLDSCLIDLIHMLYFFLTNDHHHLHIYHFLF